MKRFIELADKLKYRLPSNNPHSIAMMAAISLLRMAYGFPKNSRLIDMYGTTTYHEHLAAMEFATQWDLCFNQFQQFFPPNELLKHIVYDDGNCNYVTVCFNPTNGLIQVNINFAGNIRKNYYMGLPRDSTQAMGLTTIPGLDRRSELPGYIGYNENFFTWMGPLS